MVNHANGAPEPEPGGDNRINLLPPIQEAPKASSVMLTNNNRTRKCAAHGSIDTVAGSSIALR